MKIKSDFITNSSSTSYVISAHVNFMVNGKEVIIYKEFMNEATTLDMIKMIEGELQIRGVDSSNPVELKYNQHVEEFRGDGWDGGDYNVGGGGWRFEGNSSLLQEIMTKQNEKLFYHKGLIKVPVQWILECDPDITDIEKLMKIWEELEENSK